jgi:hypothetical protein
MPLLVEANMALGDDIRKKKQLEKEGAERVARKKREVAVTLKGEWLGNVAKDVESALKSYKDGHHISIPHHVPYADGITFDEIKVTAGFRAFRDACKTHNISAALVQRSSKDGFLMHVELFPGSEFSKQTLSNIQYR